MNKEKTYVHSGNWQALRFQEDGGYEWREPSPPRTRGDSVLRIADPFHTCGFCGSIHPSDMAEAIRGGARLDAADRKYGWPHKVYVRGAPNPYEGMMEVRSYSSGPDGVVPAPETPAGKASGKFYTIHLQDATDEEREIIERALGMRFVFREDGKVQWYPYEGTRPN